MAIIQKTSRLGNDVEITLNYNDITMKLVSISYRHEGDSSHRLRIYLKSPFSREFLIQPLSSTTTFNIPSGQQPIYSVGLKGLFIGIEWSASLGV